MTVQYLHTPAMFSSIIPNDQDDLDVLPELLQFMCLIVLTSSSGEKQNGRNSTENKTFSERNKRTREYLTVIIFNLNIHEEMFFSITSNIQLLLKCLLSTISFYVTCTVIEPGGARGGSTDQARVTSPSTLAIIQPHRTKCSGYFSAGPNLHQLCPRVPVRYVGT